MARRSPSSAHPARSASDAGATCRRYRASRRGPAFASAARMRWRSMPVDDALNEAALPGDDVEPATRPRRLEIWLPTVIIAVDQLTKAAVRARVPLHESVTVVPGFMDFTHVRNTGAAFGILDYA